MTTTVNTKGQVTIPEHLRRKYGFAPGTKVEWVERDGSIVPRPVRTWREIFGSLRPGAGEPSPMDVLVEERRADREREQA